MCVCHNKNEYKNLCPENKQLHSDTDVEKQNKRSERFIVLRVFHQNCVERYCPQFNLMSCSCHLE